MVPAEAAKSETACNNEIRWPIALVTCASQMLCLCIQRETYPDVGLCSTRQGGGHEGGSPAGPAHDDFNDENARVGMPRKNHGKAA